MKGGMLEHLTSMMRAGKITSKRRKRKTKQISTPPSGKPKQTFHGKRAVGD